MKRYDFSQLDLDNSVIITGSQRLTRHIRTRYNQWQMEQGHSVWPSLQVLPWNAWTAQCWSLLGELNHANDQSALPTRLTSQQESYLWQQIVEQSEHNNHLIQLKPTAKKAQQAWQQLQQWRVFSGSSQQGGDKDAGQNFFADVNSWDLDSQAFATWYDKFAEHTSKHNWIDEASSINLLIEQLPTIVKALPQSVLFAGFEQGTPQQKTFFDSLLNHLQVGSFNANSNASSNVRNEPQVYSFSNAREELRHAVRQAVSWVKSSLQTTTDSSEPEQPTKVALVVPELEHYKPMLERILWHELAPQSYDGTMPQGLYDISLGENLMSHRLIETVLTLIKLLSTRIDKSQLQSLLLSPYWGKSDKSIAARANLEKSLRTHARQFWTVEQATELFEKYHLEHLNELLVSATENTRDNRTIEQWLIDLPDVLSWLQWPGYRVLDTREFQLHKAFIESLQKVRQFHLVRTSQEINLAGMLDLLKRLLEDQAFHQELASAPIQIMGMLETVGLEFDHVWMTGLTHATLPQKPNPNPFINKPVLRQFDMPGSSTTREWNFATELLDNLKNSTQDLHLSFALSDGANETLPSPLLAQYHVQNLANDAITNERTENESTSETNYPSLLKTLQRTEQLETYEDQYGVALQQFSIRGGTGFFKAQINCPFQAYAKHRLSTFAFDELEEGLTAIDRGNTVHAILERFWNQHKSSEAIDGKSQGELIEMLKPVVDGVLDEVQTDLFYLKIPRFHQVERKRLLSQVSQALQVDQARQEFENVISEQSMTVEIGGLEFSMKIDRMDTVVSQAATKEIMIVDYKTGMPQRSALTTEPPSEPQLPLYALALRKDKPIAGVGFFAINANKTEYIGISDEPSNLAKYRGGSKKEPSFTEYMDNWQRDLEQIAVDIKQGNAQVAPSQKNSCDYCDYQAICRINERSELGESASAAIEQGELS